MARFIITIILAMSISYLQAQKIEYVKEIDGYHFKQNGKTLKTKKLLELMQGHPEAHQFMTSAKRKMTWVNILGFASGALIGWELYDVIAREKVDWEIIGAGLGLMLISAPIYQKANQQEFMAVELYNGNIKNTSMQWQVQQSSDGIGLAIRF
jgi:hypothetical protein